MGGNIEYIERHASPQWVRQASSQTYILVPGSDTGNIAAVYDGGGDPYPVVNAFTIGGGSGTPFVDRLTFLVVPANGLT